MAERFAYDGYATDLDAEGSAGAYVGNENWDVWADLDTGNALVTRRFFGNSVDDIVARESVAGTPAWYDTDRQGSVRFLTDGSGSVQATVTYDGFGKVASNSNLSLTDRYGYTGRELDGVAGGLVHLRDRDLSLDLLRPLTRDRLGFAAVDPNLTRYVGNGPTSFTDPSGFAGISQTSDGGPPPAVRALLQRRDDLGRRINHARVGSEEWNALRHEYFQVLNDLQRIGGAGWGLYGLSRAPFCGWQSRGRAM